MSVRGASPVRAGIDLFPAVCLLVPGSVVVAVLTSRLGRFRWAIWLGWGITTVACGLFIVFDLHTRKAVFAVALAVFGIGNGMILTGVNVATQAISKVEDRAMAACMYGFMRSLGMPIGVAVRWCPACDVRFALADPPSSCQEPCFRTQCLVRYPSRVSLLTSPEIPNATFRSLGRLRKRTQRRQQS
jgi:hypothetical protein